MRQNADSLSILLRLHGVSNSRIRQIRQQSIELIRQHDLEKTRHPSKPALVLTLLKRYVRTRNAEIARAIREAGGPKKTHRQISQNIIIVEDLIKRKWSEAKLAQRVREGITLEKIQNLKELISEHVGYPLPSDAEESELESLLENHLHVLFTPRILVPLMKKRAREQRDILVKYLQAHQSDPTEAVTLIGRLVKDNPPR